MKRTQYSSIIAYLRQHQLATYRDLMLHCGCNWPHKRLAELEGRGYSFTRVQRGEPLHTVVRLVGVPR